MAGLFSSQATAGPPAVAPTPFTVPPLPMPHPLRVQEQKQAEVGLGGRAESSPYLQKAESEMHLTPKEKDLYQLHLKNLRGPGGIDNPGGSRSTLSQTTIEADGRSFNVPTVWGGKRLKGDDLRKKIREVGLNSFPSYATEKEAEERYQEMHRFMEQDTKDFLAQRNR